MGTPVATITHQKLSEEIPFQVSPVDEVAETIRDEAIRYAREKLAVRDGGLMGLLDQVDFFEAFKYGLASAVASVIAANDHHVLAVYMYEPATNPDIESGEDMLPDATLHLLLVVSTPTAALHAFLGSLDRALVLSLKRLPSPLLKQREFIFDVNLVTERDIENGVGYSKLLKSMYAPALRVWQREE